MPEYKITNKTSATIVIDDIGVKLHANESKVISEDSYSRSRDMINHSSWVSVTRINDTKSELKRDTPFTPEIASTHLPEIALEVGVRNFHNEQISSLEERIRDLTNVMNSLVSVISSNLSTQSNNFRETIGSKTSETADSRTHSVDEPIYIQSRMIPEIGDLNIKSNQEELVKKDFDEASSAIKNLRRK